MCFLSSASANRAWFDQDIEKVCNTYGVGERYFIISNQFWLHKRHEVAIQAFARLEKKHPEVNLVLTGANWDSRVRGRIDDIRRLIDDLGLKNRIHILGQIPKLDQVALLRGSIAVIQPTAFEGGPGGGSVFDAVALGVPCVLSDIPVNREIEELVTAYFPLDDANALAFCLCEVLENPGSKPHVTDLFSEGRARRFRQGQVIWQVADLALARCL